MISLLTLKIRDKAKEVSFREFQYANQIKLIVYSLPAFLTLTLATSMSQEKKIPKMQILNIFSIVFALYIVTITILVLSMRKRHALKTTFFVCLFTAHQISLLLNYECDNH